MGAAPGKDRTSVAAYREVREFMDLRKGIGDAALRACRHLATRKSVPAPKRLI